jgi:hypothetical protein
LTGQFYCLTPDDRTAFDKDCESLLADLKPETCREKQLAVSIAEDQWRLHLHRLLAREQRVHEVAFYQEHAWNRRAPYQKLLLKMPQAA